MAHKNTTQPQSADRQQLGSAATSSQNLGSSNVNVKTPAEPLAFLRPETGEIIIVPAEDANLLRSHYNELSDMVAEFHSANSAVQLLEEHMQELAKKHASVAETEQAKKVLGFAVDWQEKAHEKLHALYEQLAPIPDEPKKDAKTGKPASGSQEDKVTTKGAGPKLIELIALKNDTEENKKRKKAEREDIEIGNVWTDDLTLKKKVGTIKTGQELMKLRKWPKTMPEKLIYVRSDKVKPSWPKFKDKEKTLWADVYKKGGDGKRSLDKAKLNTYVKEQLAKQTTISAKQIFGESLEAGSSGTLGKWADNWNKTHHTEKKPGDERTPIKVGDTQVVDIDLSASAQLMRYAYGGSLDAELSVMERHLKVKAEGHASVDFAKAEAKLELCFPRKDGWLWTVYDLNGKEYELIAGRCRITVEASGVVGASIAGELSLAVDAKQVDPGQPAKIKTKGARGRKKARQKQTVALNRVDERDVGTLEASASAFAGAKADGSLTGALEWRNPEDKNKDFVEIASVTPAIGVMAGVGAEGKFKIEITPEGLFRLTAHASLCFGVGAEGGVQFSVGPLQIAKFSMCLHYNLAYWQFQNLKIIEKKAFKFLNDLYFLAVQAGKSIEDFYGQKLTDFNNAIQSVYRELQKADARFLLAKQILSKPDALRYVPPETKGMLIYQLTRHGWPDAAKGGAIAGDNYLGPQRKAVLAILKTVVIKAEARNVIQHISADGSKGDFDTRWADLEAFFRTSSLGDVLPITAPYLKQFNDLWDSLALNGDFNGWYQAFEAHLMDEYPHGFALVACTAPEYEVMRSANDNPMFASTGMHAYYA